MRKHHTWWAALLGAGALIACGTAATAAADGGAPARPDAEPGESDHSLDGFTIGHLPEGLERHHVNASSSTDHEGNRQSEITWGEGSDDLAGRVAILRSDVAQDLDDLRKDRFSHLRTDAMERLGEKEGFENGAYLSESTGDLFWSEAPGVAVLTHLSPEQWDREELERMAVAVVPADDGTADPVQDRTGPAVDAVPEGGAEETPEAPEPGQGEGPTESGGTPGEAGQDEGPVLDVPTQDDAHERPDVVADGAPGDVTRLHEDAAFPDGIAFPDRSDQQKIPAFQQCVINRFEEHDGLSPEQEDLSGETRAFVERVQEAGELVGGERDRLMATSWYHGTQDDKLRAAEECASEQGIDEQDTDRSIDTVAGVVTELDAQSRAAFDNARVGDHADGGERAAGPIGPEEWERMREHLPWHLPTVHT